MPILAIKDNPPIRFPGISILETGFDWYIAKVKARQEKALAFDMLAMDIGYYLPLYAKSVRRPDTGKLRTTLLPLFPSYLPFSCEKVPDWLLRSDRISKVLEIRGQETFQSQLEAIYRTRECSQGLSPADQHDFEMGQRVKIIEGPCQGLSGKLVNRMNGSILVLQVEGLGFASIRVNPKHLACI